MPSSDIQQNLQFEFSLIRRDLMQIKWMLGVVLAGVLLLLVKAFF